MIEFSRIQIGIMKKIIKEIQDEIMQNNGTRKSTIKNGIINRIKRWD